MWRVELAGVGGRAVVKQFVDAPRAAERYAREVAALRLASQVTPPVAPRLLGTDPARRLLIVEHVQPGRPGEDWVVGYAEALARLHSCARAADPDALPAWSGPTEDDVDAFVALANALDVTPPAGTRADLYGLVERLTRPPGLAGAPRLTNTPGLALLHGDPCPGNDLHTSDGIRFIDFEQASLGNGLVELAYLRIGFPTCWCATAPPPRLLAEAEAAYRATWHHHTRTDVPDDLTDACAGWLLRGDSLVQLAHRGTRDHLATIPHRDWRWGTATARQRLAHRLAVVHHLTVHEGGHDGLRQLTAAMHDALRTRWPSLRSLPQQRPRRAR